MNRPVLLGVALLLLLGAYPLISFGSTRERPVLWWSGLAAAAVGGLIPPIARFTGDGADNENGNNTEQQK